ncbi:MAG: flavin reductase family protein [Geminicoccaceae bacterium]
MHYRTDQHHGLKHNPFNAVVVPRPIGWISSIDGDGNVNLAPYSFFNGIAYTPPQVMFSSTSRHEQHEGDHKDSLHNIERTKHFVVNMATWELREAVNHSSIPAPHDVDEFELTGLTKMPATNSTVPMVAECPIHLECVATQFVELESPDRSRSTNTMVIGRVEVIHIRDDVIVDGMVDLRLVKPIGRLGYRDYAVVEDLFSMDRPTWPPSDR